MAYGIYRNTSRTLTPRPQTHCVTVLTRYRHIVRVLRKGEGHCASQAPWLALSCAQMRHGPVGQVCASQRRQMSAAESHRGRHCLHASGHSSSIKTSAGRPASGLSVAILVLHPARIVCSHSTPPAASSPWMSSAHVSMHGRGSSMQSRGQMPAARRGASWSTSWSVV